MYSFMGKQKILYSPFSLIDDINPGYVKKQNPYGAGNEN